MSDLMKPEHILGLSQVAERLVRSRFSSIKSADDALFVIMTGASLGLDPVTALRGIHVISGKPTLSADLMAAVALQHPKCERFQVVEMTSERATVDVMRTGWKDSVSYTFTVEDAKCAGLWGKGNWRTYPQMMLKARAISMAARAAFPDALLGCYVHGELGDDQDNSEESRPTEVRAEVVHDEPPVPRDYADDPEWKKQVKRFFGIVEGAAKEDGADLAKEAIEAYRKWWCGLAGVTSWKHVSAEDIKRLNDKLYSIPPEDVVEKIRQHGGQHEPEESENTDQEHDQKDGNRIHEFRALLHEAVGDEVVAAFTVLYVDRMGERALERVGYQKLGAMCRRLRSQSLDARRDYVEGVIADAKENAKEVA